MIRFSAFTISALLGVAAASAGALAWSPDEIVCEDRINIVAGLADTYSEKPVSMGITEQGTVLKILAGPNGNWTMIETLPSGKACLVASGEKWRDRIPQTKPSRTSY